MKPALSRTLAAGGAVVVLLGISVLSLGTSRSLPEMRDGAASDAIGRVAGIMGDMAQSVPMTAAAPVAPPAAKMSREERFAAGNEASQTFRQPTTSQSMIIRNAHVDVQVNSLEQAIASVRRLATALGGHIGSMNTQTGEHQVRSAMLVMKIPAARFDSAMLGLPALGKVESSSANAEDVGEEFVDVTARVANARRLESRLVTLLATRTGKLDDVLTVERELARVRQEIERYEGRLKWIGTQVAVSTISVNVHEKAPIIATPGTNPIGDAFILAWKNFVRLVASGIAASGVLVPLALLGWIGFVIWRRVRGPLAAG